MLKRSSPAKGRLGGVQGSAFLPCKGEGGRGIAQGLVYTTPTPSCSRRGMFSFNPIINQN